MASRSIAVQRKTHFLQVEQPFSLSILILRYVDSIPEADVKWLFGPCYERIMLRAAVTSTHQLYAFAVDKVDTVDKVGKVDCTLRGNRTFLGMVQRGCFHSDIFSSERRT